MEQSDDPSIELYMYSLNQEFPVKKGHATYLKRYSELKPSTRGDLTLNSAIEEQVYRIGQDGPHAEVPPDWSVQWLSNRWIQNTEQAFDQAAVIDPAPLRNLIVREEEFGAIVFDPGNDRVYKVNPAGLNLINQMREQARAGISYSNMRLTGFDGTQIDHFAERMKVAGLIA